MRNYTGSLPVLKYVYNMPFFYTRDIIGIGQGSTLRFLARRGFLRVTVVNRRKVRWSITPAGQRLADLDGHRYYWRAVTYVSQPPIRSNFRIKGLTARQYDVLKRIASSQTIKEIAYDLGLSQKTVEYHKQVGMQSLGIQGDVLLTHWAIANDVVQLLFPKSCTVGTT